MPCLPSLPATILLTLALGCSTDAPTSGKDGNVPTHTPVDADGDGVSAGEDCDDDDPSIFPLAGDVHGDGVDSDCDGLDR